MKLPEWPYEEEPFHVGEQSAQSRSGVRERLAEVGRHTIRTEMPQQHRDFFPRLPFVAVAGVDSSGQPQATLLTGRAPGFATAPDPRTLRIDALPPGGDPLGSVLALGAELGVLGIELPTRRRNRVNGVVTALDARGFAIRVRQSFGNCPKYIQTRSLQARPPESDQTRAEAPLWSDRIDARSQALVRAADTFFVGTHAAPGRASGGADVSHRGGRPGFIRVSDDGLTLTWPEFAGNLYFNTLGNLLIQPRAALVVPDFERGDLLHVCGRCTIEWSSPDVDAFAGARHLVRMQVDAVCLRPRAWPLRWQLVEVSPFLHSTGQWR